MQANGDAARLLALYTVMQRIRAFEEYGLEGFRAGYVHSTMHAAIGQEAVAAGVCGRLECHDVLLSTHRGHGHALAKGADSTAMMCELFGRATGTCGGKGGSVHLADFGVSMLGANGVIGANIEIAAGAAHAIRLRGEDRIVVCMMGDGAVNRGPFLEGLNWARIYDLPVLFVCEDNGFAASTRTASVTGGPGIAARVEALGIPVRDLDGNDVLAVDEAAAEAIEAIRGGQGPHFILARTYRLLGHSASDRFTYRSGDEVDDAWSRDPIERCARLLQRAGVPLRLLEERRATAWAEIAAAFDAAVARTAARARPGLRPRPGGRCAAVARRRA